MKEGNALKVESPKCTRWSVDSSGLVKGCILREGVPMLPEDVVLYLNSVEDLREQMKAYFGRSKDAVFLEAENKLAVVWLV